MLRTWPIPLPSSIALGTLCILLACSSAGTEQITDSQSSNADDGSTATSQQTGVTAPTTGETGPGESSDEAGSITDVTGDPSSPTTNDPSTATSTTDTNTSGDTTTVSTGTTTTGTSDTSTGDTSTTGEDSSTGETPEVCSDLLKNGDETDVDCGGPLCAPCGEGKTCAADVDCNSGSCDADLCIPATCDDSKRDGDETDIDCGGSCEPCLEGEVCQLGTDCDSGVCDANLCVAAACDDKVKNADETDLDCGGSTCDPCTDALACLLADDCQSGVCTATKCAVPTCSDAVQNGIETGIDCGGPTCAPCQLATLTINEVDYDNVGDDNAEFVEIYNNTGAPVDLATVRLIGVNGNNNATYLNLSLAAGGTLMQGQYLVVGPPAFPAPPGVIKVNFAKAKDILENGAPDGIALIDTGTGTLLDALSYEGAMTMATVTGLGVVSLVEGMVLDLKIQDSQTEQRSLIRFPNGNDKNNAATDWAISKNPTPGLPNTL